MHKGAILFVGILLVSANSQADYTGTGDELARFAAAYEHSRAQGNLIYGGPELAMDIAYYSGFVNGVALSTLGIAWCPREAFSMAQIWSVAAKFLAEHPQQWNQPPATLVALGLASAYPCKRTSTQP